MTLAAQRVLLALAILVLGAALPAHASRFWRGNDASPATAPRPDAGRNVEQGAPVSLRLVDRGSHHEVRVGNRLPGPVEVQLGLRRSENISAVPAMPVRATVGARAEVVVARLYASDPGKPHGFDVQLEQTLGDPHARPLDYRYGLPFDQARVSVGQGPGGRFSHDDAQTRHAVDFALPEGTPVLAAREGVVLQLESGFAGTGLDRERYATRANQVRILHPDGSMAVYAHLAPKGVLVQVGQQVRKGQQIALSGNTGYSTAPHLHFVVQVNRGMRLESVPFRMFAGPSELRFARGADSDGH